MEALKHSEWTLGVIFYWFAFHNAQLTAVWILIVLISSQLPDFVSLFLKKISIPSDLARKITHDYLIVIFLWLIILINNPVLFFYNNPETWLIANGIAIHYVVDLFSGLEPIYIGGIFLGERTAAQYVSADDRIAIGKRIESWGSNYLITQIEHPTPELAWFWIMQLSGTIFCCLGMIFYLM
ncbi:MAG: hypothetical protein ACFFFH_21415 [Candidatus Thorarchaeota archaeon]